jgi:hypothetical protein
MPSTDCIGSLRTTALLAGFPPTICDEDLHVLAGRILADGWLWAQVEKNWQLEARSPKPCHPDLVLNATLRSLTGTERANLRKRVYHAEPL